MVHKDNTAYIHPGNMTSEEHRMTIQLILAKMSSTNRYFLNFQNNQGWTALCFAAKSGAKKVIHEPAELEA